MLEVEVLFQIFTSSLNNYCIISFVAFDVWKKMLPCESYHQLEQGSLCLRGFPPACITPSLLLNSKAKSVSLILEANLQPCIHPVLS